MAKHLGDASTGVDGLDRIIQNLRKGDNVVWQIDQIEHYCLFASRFAERAISDDKKVIYIRFASHRPIFTSDQKIKIYTLDALTGFEAFSARIHNIISEEGREAYYVFDCLSDLLTAWATDLMLGNFFIVTCPYLYELDTVAYFAILRNSHPFKTVARIRETTQVLIDLYNFEGNYYVYPLKVLNRYTPTMFMPHLFEGGNFLPVTSSASVSAIFSYISKTGAENTDRNLDYWDRMFLNAEKISDSTSAAAEKETITSRIINVMMTREHRMAGLLKNNFSISNLLQIKKRLIGTGYVGGKTAGMLLARNILLKDKTGDWEEILESHDSFYIGSDVFYSYIVQNGWWKLWMEHKTEQGYFSAAEKLKEKMLAGVFPDEIKEQFFNIIEYFGQAPIIIRSSSLLEDSFGNAFAGKYESIFCVNQGSPEERYRNFENSVKKVFASTMNENAITYRLQRGLAFKDEQMALLVQRVSGSVKKQYFFPDFAGVGFSHNIYLWQENMNPKAGMLRLVAGLGTRSVNRVADDYPRLVALDMPLSKPHAGIDDARKFSQHEIDVLDIEKNSFETMPMAALVEEGTISNLPLIGLRDEETSNMMKQFGSGGREFYIINFDGFLSGQVFTGMMKKMLNLLEDAYTYPVEIEFTGNFIKDEAFKINLLQCRPLQANADIEKKPMPENIDKKDVIFSSKSFFIGGNVSKRINQVVMVEPKEYLALNQSQKYDVARTIGKINKTLAADKKTASLLIGPGRWGTSSPSMGVPVNFYEINNFSVIVEFSYKNGNMMPELSYGTHFFQDLVETNIFYIALFLEKNNVFFDPQWFAANENLLLSKLPETENYSHIVKFYDVSDKNFHIFSDIISQKVVLLKTSS
jgi:hypothetical protein